MDTETGYEIVYGDMKEGARRGPVSTKTGYETVCRIPSKEVVY